MLFEEAVDVRIQRAKQWTTEGETQALPHPKRAQMQASLSVEENQVVFSPSLSFIRRFCSQ
jgi:hypothetical protein